MKLDIKYDENKQPIGWSIQGEIPEEIDKVNTIRHLQFFGMGDMAIEYNGRTSGSDKNNNVGTLHWVQKKHMKK